MKARIEWKDGMSFLGESGSGHQDHQKQAAEI